jgi:hypothetical protein
MDCLPRTAWLGPDITASCTGMYHVQAPSNVLAPGIVNR